MKKLILIALSSLFIQSAMAVFANNTPVDVPGGQKVIANFMVGDLVLNSEGKAERVFFSSGIANTEQTMIYLVFGDDHKVLIVSSDQPIETQDHRLVRASKLMPGDMINSSQGPVAVQSLTFGQFRGGVHDIAFGDLHYDGTPHLFLANGIFVGDFMTKLHCDELCQE